MNDKITNIQLAEFLQDFEKRSTTIIIEEGKERNEVMDIAKAKGILLKGVLAEHSIDLAGFKTVYAFTDKPNDNGAILPKARLLKALPTLVGKPINIDHNRRYIVGYYIDFKYVAKKNMVIAYGIFFKFAFSTEWKEVVRKFKANKLATSFEIWSPEKDYVHYENGTYDMAEMEVAGGAIMFEEEPAFEDAKVLELAKIKKVIDAPTLETASAKYKCNDILTTIGNLKCRKCGKCKVEKGELKMAEPETKVEVATPPEAVKPIVATAIKIKCLNCEEEFLPMDTISVQLKCPKCSAIVDRAGTMLYPPQIMNFKVSCACGARDWILIKHTDKGEKAVIHCRMCSKDYEVAFVSLAVDELIKIPTFMYEGDVACRQCQQTLYFNTTSDQPKTSVQCNKCGLTFDIDISKHCQRKVKAITEIPKLEKASKGVTPMSKKGIKKEKAKVEDTLKDLAGKVTELKAQLVTANKKSKRAKKILFIAKELKGLLREARGNKTLTDLELASVQEDVKIVEGELDVANEQLTDKEQELETANQKTKFYKENANKLVERKAILGEDAKDMSDEEILSDKDFEIASLKKEKSELENSDSVDDIDVATENAGDLVEGSQKENRYKKIQSGVNKIAFDKKEGKE